MPENIEDIKRQVPEIAGQANRIVVSNPQDYIDVAFYLKTVKSALKEVNDKIITPAETVKRAAEVNRKNLVNLFRVPLEKAESIIKRKLLDFDQKRRRQAAEEQARLQAEADAQAAREQNKLLKEAENLKTPELQEQRLAEAAEVEAPVVTVATVTPKVAGISTRKTWKGEIVDKGELITAALQDNTLWHWIDFDQSKINRFANDTKGQVAKPGIRFYEVETMAAGGR